MMRRVPLPPLHLSPDATAILLVILLGVLLLVVAWGVLEFVFGQTADVALRVSGHQKPRKSPARLAIDQLEARLRRRG